MRYSTYGLPALMSRSRQLPPALFYLRPSLSSYRLHPCKRPALFYLPCLSASLRLGESIKSGHEGLKSNKSETPERQKINWPNLMFGPVNLWCLPSASFFYGKLAEKKSRGVLT